MNDQKYVLTITRENATEFKAEFDHRPDDAFGKRIVALILLNIAESLDSKVISQKQEQ
jgi:hypothetical protein